VKLLVAITLFAVIATSACIYQASASGQPALNVAPTPIPVGSTKQTDSGPIRLPRAVVLRVPFTSQAPLGDWPARQHTCEEASLLMVDRYLRGDRSGRLIDPLTADHAIREITLWKPAVDLTPQQLGEMAQLHMGWAYTIQPATGLAMEQQLALGRPLIVGVRTHGLGNPSYPGYFTHYDQPGWSVSHYLVVVGYDATGNFIVNDPGITLGHGYRITYDQLMHAIDDLDRAYPTLDAGRVFLVLAPDPKNS
jgi:Peptidase_C39 like family